MGGGWLRSSEGRGGKRSQDLGLASERDEEEEGVVRLDYNVFGF